MFELSVGLFISVQKFVFDPVGFHSVYSTKGDGWMKLIFTVLFYYTIR